MRTARIFICGIILVLAVLFPNVTAENDCMKLLVLLDQEDYSRGDTGKVTVHVFDKGEYIDSDKIPNCLIKSLDFTDETERDITLEKKSTGIFEGDFKIFTSDSEDFNFMEIEANATYGKSDENDTEYNRDDNSQYFFISSEVRVSILNGPTSVFPGDTFTLRIEVKKGDVLMDADDLDIKYLLDYEERKSDEGELPYDKVDTGIYEAVMEVPKSIKESCEINIMVEATIDEESGSGFGRVSIDFFSVWYKKGSVGQTICTFDVYVADKEGKAVSGADIKLSWFEDDWSSSELEATKLTDSSGKASFEITYEKGAENLGIEGRVLKDGKTQFLEGDVDLKEDSGKEGVWGKPKDSSGFDIVLKKNSFSGKSPYTLDCRAFRFGQRISKKEVYYYFYTDMEVIAYGTATTDIDGEFSVEFSYNPRDSNDGIALFFETVRGDYDDDWGERENSLDGKEYTNEYEYISFETDDTPDINIDDTSIKINVEKLKHGGLTDVAVTGIPMDSMPLVGGIPGSVNSIQDIEEWGGTLEWDQWGGEGLRVQEMNISDGKTTFKLMVPEFMPSGKYTIFAGYIDISGVNDPDFSVEDAYHINHLIVETDKSTTSTETNENSFFSSNGFIYLSVGILVIILAVILAIVLMVKRKKRRIVSDVSEADDKSQQRDSEGEQPQDQEQKVLPEHQFTP